MVMEEQSSDNVSVMFYQLNHTVIGTNVGADPEEGKE
jgi:hypothetical protein